MTKLEDAIDLSRDYEACVLHEVLAQKAAAAPDRPFIVGDAAPITLGAFDAAVSRAAAGLATCGLGVGHRCAVMMTNSPDYLATWLGISRAGGVEVPLNTAYRGSFLSHALTCSEASIIVADAQFAEAIAEVLPECPGVRLVILRDDGSGAPRAAIPPRLLRDFAACLQVDGTLPERRIGFADPACILFTSGTTGASKGAVISHRQLLAFGITYQAIVRSDETDVFYNYLPFFHVAGKFIFMAALQSDARMLLRERLSVSSFWEDVRKFGCTVTTAVGGMCNMLYAQPTRPDDADNPMRLIYAVPIPYEIRATFEKRFGLGMVEGYGATECNIIAWTSLDDPAPQGSCGRPSPWYEVCIMDELCRPVPDGQSGEIVVRGRTPWLLMDRYFGMAEQTVEVYRQQWFHTGDRGRLEDGWLYFIDRMKDSIRRRGENISSYEVEQSVLKHPSISEAAAVAVPSDLQEDEVKLVVVCRDGAALSAEDLFLWCGDALPGFMVPRYIEFRTELPRTPTLKVRKVDLREAGEAAQIWDCQDHGYRISARGIRRQATEPAR